MAKITIPKISLEDIKIWFRSIDRKTLIQTATIAGAFLVFVLVFFFPILIENKRLVGEVKVLQAKVSQATVKILKIPEMTKQKKLFGERTKKIREQFFAADEADKLIEIISTIAADAGVKISATRPAAKLIEIPAPFSKTYMPFSYEFAVEGSYHNLGTFINSLEHYAKNFAVHDTEIVAPGDKTLKIQQSTLVITAFLKRPQTS